MIKRILITIVMSFSCFGLFGQTNKFKTVDVAEYAEGHIPGTHFNIDVLEDRYTEIALKTLPKEKPVALYCRSGNRSKNAARILAENGYQVLELGTGFQGWAAAGKKVEIEKQ